ncbi:F-box/kelch-repeat protein At3g23880-like [Lycium ferocissimum]|uniref:F-box/kelch-repeat protein At3g23880-like n=1 Tax=Lycium ferocissimum TaxID=112874 RepID=UPI0028168AF7|nr:F-box/kelch-repeat protein At3g23880-like [Lycium ferocissimum]XP_059282527.1 F-box/kelch-repeat protein At3g23880-like [Lycium ferocissimum]
MESEVVEASYQHSKCSRLTNQAQFSSTSVKDSILTIPILPPELITEILLRLPVKSLLKFRAVSKSWLSLISSPEFIKNHLSVSANNKDYTHHRVIWSFRQGFLNLKDCTLNSFFSESVTEVFDLNYRMTSDGLYDQLPQFETIVGSVNGLICLADEKNNVFLWNPSNRKYKKLPTPRPALRFEMWRMNGFGYDELHDDYKLVGTFRRCGRFNRGRLKLYSLKSDSWRSVDPWANVADRRSREQLDVSGKFVKGKLYWPTATVDGLYVFYKEWNITSFDLANEKWGKVEHPCYEEGDIDLLLEVLGSDLSVFCNNHGKHISIWIMKEYGVKESWTKMFTINYPDRYVGDRHVFFLPYFMSNKGEILVMFLFHTTSMIYNPKDDSLRYSKVIEFNGGPKAEVYVESLVCPFSREGAADATKTQKATKA